MTKELKMLVGVALLAALALAGALGIFTFSAVPARRSPGGSASTSSGASRGARVAPGGTVDGDDHPRERQLRQHVTETLPRWVGSPMSAVRPSGCKWSHRLSNRAISRIQSVRRADQPSRYVHRYRARWRTRWLYVLWHAYRTSLVPLDVVILGATTVTVGTGGTNGGTNGGATNGGDAPATLLKLSSKVAGAAVQVVANANRRCRGK